MSLKRWKLKHVENESVKLPGRPIEFKIMNRFKRSSNHFKLKKIWTVYFYFRSSIHSWKLLNWFIFYSHVENTLEKLKNERKWSKTKNKTSVDKNLFLILLEICMRFSHEKLLRKYPHASLKREWKTLY